MSQKIKTSVEVDGSLSLSQIANSSVDTDKFLVSDGGLLKYRTGIQLLSDLGVGDGFVPYTGSISNVDLGEFGLKSGNIQFDLTPTNTPTTQGTMSWNADKNTLDLIMNGTTGSVMQDLFFDVKNQTGVTIQKGTVVRANGTVGASGRILIAPFIANNSYDSKFCIGVTSENIIDGADGKVTAFGAIRQIDTSFFPNGTILYASPTVSGGFTSTEPSNPDNIVTVGIVVFSDVNNGELFVRPTYIPSEEDLIRSLGYTPADDLNVVHRTGDESIAGIKNFTNNVLINTTVDNTFDALQVSGSTRSITTLPDGITAKILTFPTSPYGLVFRSSSDGSHSIQNQREGNDTQLYPLLLQPLGSGVGIGTLNLAAPNTGGFVPALAVASLSGGILQLRNTTTTTLAGYTLGNIQFTSSYYGTPFASANIRAIALQSASGGSGGGAHIIFETSNGGTGEWPSERMRIASNGNVGVGTTSPTEKLHVFGNGLFTGNISTTSGINVTGGGVTSTVVNASSVFTLGTTSAHPFTLRTSNIERFRILSTGEATFTSSIRVTGAFKDSNDSSGTSGQVLSSTGTGTTWVTNGGSSSGLKGIHSLIELSTGQSTTVATGGFSLSGAIEVANRVLVTPYIPANNVTTQSLSLNVSIPVAAALIKIVIFSNSGGKPGTKLYESANLDCSTTGIKTANVVFNFIAGTTYWLGTHSSSNPSINVIRTVIIPISSVGTTSYFSYSGIVTFGSLGNTIIPDPVLSTTTAQAPFISINL